MLARANLIKKTDFDTKLISLNNSNTTKHLLVENELKKNYKHLIQFISEAKVISRKMAQKII